MTHTIRMALLAALAFPVLARAGEVSYGGSSTVVEIFVQGGAAKALEAKTGVRLRIADVSGTGKGLKSLADGKIDVAGSGRTLTPEERRGGLLGTTVAYDGLAVWVNQANPVKELSKDQLKDLLTGKVKSWKELGGKDVKISPMIEPIASKRATVQLVQELVLDGADFAPGIRELEQLGEQLVEVARDEGAICVASVGFLANLDAAVKGRLRPLSLDGVEPSDANIRSGAYLLSRPMLLVTKGLAQGDVKQLLDFMLSRDGQAVVEKSFVSVKK